MAEKTIDEAIDKVVKSNELFKDEVIKKTVAEVDKLATHIKDEDTKHAAVVETINKDLAAKGATLLDIQGEVKNINEKMSRFRTGLRDGKKNIIEFLGEQFSSKGMIELFNQMGESAESNVYGKSFKMSTKVATVTTGSLASANYIDYLPWQAGMEPLGQTRIRQFVGTIESDFDHVQFPRANSPVGLGSFNDQTTEGNLKTQIDRGWTMQSLTLYPFAGWTAVSRQSLRNILFLQTWLPISLNEQLLDQEDLKFANLLVGAATGSSTLTGVSTTVSAECLIGYVTNLKKTKFNPNLIALDPVKWSTLAVTKPSNYSLPNVLNIAPDGTMRLLGIQVQPVNWLTGSRTLIGDFSKASIVQSEGLTFRQSENGTSQDFMSNVVTFLLERTEGLAIFRPDAFVTAILPAG